MKVADLYVNLGLTGQNEMTKGLDKVGSSLKELFSLSIGTKLTLAGIITGFVGAAFSAGKTGAAMMHFRGAFDLSSQELQRWQYAARQFGVGAEGVQSSIEGIQNAIANAKLGGEFSEVFGKLGIDISGKKDAFDILKQIQARIKAGNTDAMRIWSSGLISTELFQFLKRGPDMSKFKAPKGMLLSDAQLRQQERISVAFDNFGGNLKRTMEAFIAKNEPLITKLIDRIEKLLEGLLKYFDKIEQKSGLIPRLVRGEGVSEAVAKSSVDAMAALGDWMVKAPVKALKDSWSDYAEKVKRGEVKPMGPGFSQLTAPPVVDVKKEAAPKETVAGKYEPDMVVEERGNTMNIYFGQVDMSDSLSRNTKDEIKRAAMQISRGNK